MSDGNLYETLQYISNTYSERKLRKIFSTMNRLLHIILSILLAFVIVYLFDVQGENNTHRFVISISAVAATVFIFLRSVCHSRKDKK